MRRTLISTALITLMAACAAPVVDIEQALSNQRLTFPSPDPEGGPIIFEFYAGGEGLLAFDEVADRGQSPLRWSIEGQQLCLMELDGSRRDCSDVVVRGNFIVIGPDRSAPLRGTFAPL